MSCNCLTCVCQNHDVCLTISFQGLIFFELISVSQFLFYFNYFLYDIAFSSQIEIAEHNYV